MTVSSIEWTDATWNPIVGCSIVSPGCTNCYAMRMAARLEAMGVQKYAGLTRKTGGRFKWNGVVRLDRKSLEEPLSWHSPRMIFVNSMSDLFHDKVDLAALRAVWSVMQRCPHHIFQILTKRDERMAELSYDLPLLDNVWLGVSVEDSEYLPRIDSLRSANAAVKFISFEPLVDSVGRPNLKGIDWCIVGGESGPGARPMIEEWVEDLLAAARAGGAAFHFKQWGGTRKKRTGRKLHGRTYDEFPGRPLMPAESR